MYAQICTHPDIAYKTTILGRYLSNLELDYLKVVKWVIQYLQRTKDFILTYRRFNYLEVRTQISTLLGAWIAADSL